MLTNKCFKCGELITSENDSEEHVLLNAIGGRKVVRGFVCIGCNNETGESWDAELARQLNPLGLLLGIKRYRGSLPSQSFRTVSGEQSITINSESQMSLAKPKFESVKTDNGLEVKLTARSMQEARRMLTDLKKKHSELDVDKVMELTKPISYHLEEPLHMTFDFGGEKTGRSLVKSVLAMASDAGLSVDSADDALDYLRNVNGKPCFGYYYETDLIIDRPEGIVFHCVCVQGRPQTRQLLGYIELYSAFRMVIGLSPNYSGPEFTNTYSINPSNGEKMDLHVDIPLSQDDIQAAYRYEKIPAGSQEKAMETVLKASIAGGLVRERTRIITEAVDYGFNSLDLTEGEIITPEQLQILTGHIMEKLTPWLIRNIAGNRSNDSSNISYPLGK